MKKDNIILGGLVAATAIVSFITVKMKINDAYITGRTDQLNECTKELERLTKLIKTNEKES